MADLKSADWGRSRDLELGMHRNITRRDFMNGAAMVIGASMLPGARVFGMANSSEPQNESGYDPPVKTGLRGSHPGSFEIAHSLRDGTFWDSAGKPVESGETYDLVIVGGGISGLAAAYFFREKAGNSARILILENHDDFGGHAKAKRISPGRPAATLERWNTPHRQPHEIQSRSRWLAEEARH